MDKQINYLEIAIKNISIILTIRGLNVSKMEKEIGVSNAYFSRLKRKGNPSFDMIVKMAKYLNVSLDELIKTDFMDGIEERFKEK